MVFSGLVVGFPFPKLREFVRFGFWVVLAIWFNLGFHWCLVGGGWVSELNRIRVKLLTGDQFGQPREAGAVGIRTP